MMKADNMFVQNTLKVVKEHIQGELVKAARYGDKRKEADLRRKLLYNTKLQLMAERLGLDYTYFCNRVFAEAEAECAKHPRPRVCLDFLDDEPGEGA